MNRRFALSFCSLALLVALAVANADEKGKAGAVMPAQTQFEQLKRLAGDWIGNADHGDVKHEATISYKVTSAGRTVQETIFAGTPHEMVTMYHLDGDALLLTHYCAIGNQPRMKAEPAGGLGIADDLLLLLQGHARVRRGALP